MYITLNGNKLKSLKNTISKKHRLPKSISRKEEKERKTDRFLVWQIFKILVGAQPLEPGNRPKQIKGWLNLPWRTRSSLSVELLWGLWKTELRSSQSSAIYRPQHLEA